MIPILYEATETRFVSNGLGRLSAATSCFVKEERNGEYELEMQYPIAGPLFGELQESRIISAVPADGKERQPFRIYRITKGINGIAIINAEHISYQLSLVPVMPFTATTAPEAVIKLKANATEAIPFDLWTDITTEANYTQRIPKSFRACLGGSQGSFLDTYGGEFEWDNWTVKIHASRGLNKGVTIRYGKNLTDLEQEENIQDTYTGIVPYWYKEETETLVTLPEKVVMSDNADRFPFHRVLPHDFTSNFEQEPSAEALRTAAQNYVRNNNIGIPKVSLDVSFVALWQTDEYKDRANQERINLCDTVTVVFEELGVSSTAKVIETKYNVLLDRYESIKIGEAKSSFADTFVKEQQETQVQIDSAKSELQKAVEIATDLINNGFGGYVTFKPNADGDFEELLIMDTKDPETATKVWRWNLNGLGYSSNGYDGPYTSAITMDGHIVADFVDTGTLNANIVKAGVLSDTNGNTTLNMTTGALTAKRLSVESTNFKLTESGNITANNASMSNVSASGNFETSRKEWRYGKYVVYSTVESAGQLAFQKDGTSVAELSVWGSIYPWGTSSNSVDAVNINLDGVPFSIGTNPLQGETKYGWYYRFAVNDEHKSMGFNEWVYAESIFVGDSVRFGDPDGPEIGRGTGNTFLVGAPNNQCGLAVWGNKNRVVMTENYGAVGMNAVESATALFSDVGSGRLDEKGTCFVYITPDFLETIDLSHEYQVFVTKTSEGHIERVEKHNDYFAVIGDPETSFDWIIYAKQKGYTNYRMEGFTVEKEDINAKAGLYPVIKESEIIAEASNYLQNYESEVESW